MKKILLLFILFACLMQNSFGTTYYVASVANGGNDANNGTSTLTPWTSLNKVNSTTFQAGDNVLFNRGDVWYGTLKVTNQGTSGNPITYGAYGTGAKPIITGFTTITSWTNKGNNIWESTNAVSTLPYINMVVIGGVNTARGRWPNSGYNPYQSHNTNTSITSTSLNSSVTDWTGAEICIKRERWYIETDTITSASGSSVTFNDLGQYGLQSNWGFFIQNDIRTLDQQNEWYYNPSTKKLDIYSTSQPQNVQIPTVQATFVDSSNYSYVTVDNMAFTGSNQALMDWNFSQHTVTTNCDLTFGGTAGIVLNGSTPTASNNTINTVGYTGIQSDQNGINGTFTNNNIKNVALIPGTKERGGGAAIYNVGANSLMQNNVIDSIGWGGICVYGNNSIAQNNFVNHFAFVRDDCAGIATHHGYTGVEFLNNIVLNGIGNVDGTNDNYSFLANGLYFDDLTQYATADGNSVYNCSGVGMQLHRTNHDRITNNTFFNCGTANNYTNGMLYITNTSDAVTSNDTLKNNIFIAKTAGQRLVFYTTNSTNSADLQTMFDILDSNYYARPIADDNQAFKITIGGTTTYTDFAGWQTATGKDAHSHKSPRTISDTTGAFQFLYNETSQPKTFTLAANYIDVKNTALTGNLTLQPFTSIVLMQGSAIAAPTLSTSGDQNILVTSTTLYAVPTWASGHSGTVYWQQISGAASIIDNQNSLNVNITGLTNGAHQYQCTATQDDGQSVSKTVTVNVSGIPVANAGGDHVIFLRPVKPVNK